MTWVPGNEQRYNRFLSPRVPSGLNTNCRFAIVEGQRHPGLNGIVNDTNVSILTPFVAFRPVIPDYTVPKVPTWEEVLRLGTD